MPSSTRLAATLVKSATHWKAFETAFEVYFSMRGSQYEIDAEGGAAARPDENGEMPPGDGQGRQGGGGGEGLTPEELAEMLYRALMSANEAQIAALARQAVARFAGMEPGRPVGGTYYLYRTLAKPRSRRRPRAADGTARQRTPPTG